MRTAQIFSILLVSNAFACDLLKSTEGPESSDPDTELSLALVSSESCPLPEGLDPQKVTILSYKVRVTSHIETGVPANYFYASLLTTDGERYLAEYPGCDPVLSGTPLGRGQSGEGFLNFPLPPSKTPEKIVYSPVLIDGEKAPLVELTLRGARPPAPAGAE